jgi:subtilisin-like proprotein convertase family protein
MAGCTDEDNVIVTVSASSGPFVVTAPNTSNVEWTAGEVETVTWNVANTTNAPVSCPLVDILLSYDGGYTYPDILAEDVANDGSQTITVPAVETTTARVMVRCSDNIFFDISNADFEIVNEPPTYLLNIDPNTQTGCPPGQVQYTVAVIAINGYADPVQLSSQNLPPDITVAYVPSQVIPGNTAQMNVSMSGNLTSGAHTLTVLGESLGDIKTAFTELVTGTPLVDLLVPANEATGVSLEPELICAVDGDADTYTIEVSTDAFFSEIVLVETISETEYTAEGLEASSIYYWRVRASNLCGAGAWSEVRVFQTANCQLNYSAEVPITISSNGMPSITSTLKITLGGVIADVNVVDLEGTHTALGDLRFTLRSPAGTAVVLIDQWCTSQDNFDINLDDQASPGSPPCPYNNGGTYQPENPLSAFNGENPDGIWELTVDDQANFNGGSLNSWALEICLENDCALMVTNINNAGIGSLRSTLDCATAGDTITFAPALDDKTITLSTKLSISEDIHVVSVLVDGIIIDGSATTQPFEILADAAARIEGLTIQSGQNSSGCGILNHGTLVLRDVIVHPGGQSQNELVLNLGNLTLEGNCEVNH